MLTRVAAAIVPSVAKATPSPLWLRSLAAAVGASAPSSSTASPSTAVPSAGCRWLSSGEKRGGLGKKFDVNEDRFSPFKKRDDHAYVTGGGRYMPGFSFPAPRDLSSIVKFALLEREDAATIKMIWEDFHKDRSDAVARVVSAGEFEGFRDRARRYPNFVYPVFKGDGNFFTLFAQWQDRHCILTYLEDYKQNPASAEPYLAVSMFDDLVDRKGVVLVRGDFSWHLTKPDAEALLKAVEHFYLREPALVETFNTNPNAFDFNALMQAMPRE